MIHYHFGIGKRWKNYSSFFGAVGRSQTLTMDYVFLLVLIFGLAAAEKQRFDGHKVIRLYPTNEEHLDLLANLENHGIKGDVWREPSGLGYPVDVQLDQTEAEPFMKRALNLNIPHLVILDDLQQHLENLDQSVQDAANDPASQDFTRYLTYAEIMIWLEAKNTDCGSRCSILSIGTSTEGRDLKVLKIGTPGENKRTIWLDAGIHAREWISPATAMYFIERLVDDYDTDSVVKQIVDTYDWYFLTVMNPDGYQYTWDTNRMWRKSRSINITTTCVGADVNRNFDFQWRTVGASSDPCSNTFAGHFPFSEPEAKAVGDFITNIQDTFDVYFTLHSYGQLMMAPWGYSFEEPPDYAEMILAGQVCIDALAEVHGTVYRLGSASNILYRSSGTSRDWAKGVPQIKYVYTFELRDTGIYGFLLPPEQILPTGQETWAGVKAFMELLLAKRQPQEKP